MCMWVSGYVRGVWVCVRMWTTCSRGKEAWVSVGELAGSPLLYGEGLTAERNESYLISWCLGEIGRFKGHNFE